MRWVLLEAVPYSCPLDLIPGLSLTPCIMFQAQVWWELIRQWEPVFMEERDHTGLWRAPYQKRIPSSGHDVKWWKKHYCSWSMKLPVMVDVWVLITGDSYQARDLYEILIHKLCSGLLVMLQSHYVCYLFVFYLVFVHTVFFSVMFICQLWVYCFFVFL